MKKIIYSIFCLITVWITFSVPLFALGKSSIITNENYENQMLVQNGTITKEGNALILESQSDPTVLLIAPADFKERINVLEFKNLDYLPTAVIFTYKRIGQEYDPNAQIPLQIKNWKLTLPNPIIPAQFEFIGLIFAWKKVRFESFSMRMMSFSDRFQTLMEVEYLKPSTINLIYGPKFGNIPLVSILWVFALILVSIFLFVDKRWAFLVFLWLWGLFDLRYTYDLANILFVTDSQFVWEKDDTKKYYYDFGNLYGFIDRAKKHITGNVNFYAPRDWPFRANFEYHLFPHKALWQTTTEPFYAIFERANVEIKNSKELYIDGKLIDSNITLIDQFGKNSYFLKKN